MRCVTWRTRPHDRNGRRSPLHHLAGSRKDHLVGEITRRAEEHERIGRGHTLIAVAHHQPLSLALPVAERARVLHAVSGRCCATTPDRAGNDCRSAAIPLKGNLHAHGLRGKGQGFAWARVQAPRGSGSGEHDGGELPGVQARAADKEPVHASGTERRRCGRLRLTAPRGPLTQRAVHRTRPGRRPRRHRPQHHPSRPAQPPGPCRLQRGSFTRGGQLPANFPCEQKARNVRNVAPAPGSCNRDIRGNAAGPGVFFRARNDAGKTLPPGDGAKTREDYSPTAIFPA